MRDEIPAEVLPLVDGIGRGGNQEKQSVAALAKRIGELTDGEALWARRDAAWARRMEPIKLTSEPTTYGVYGGIHPCDRCSHETRRHAGPDDGSHCRVSRMIQTSKGPERRRCLCDGLVVITGGSA